jgi:hypothetical protein
METDGISIGTLIANKTPDDSGKILPLDTTSGVAIWMMAHHGSGKGRILQSNASTGMARSFSCNEYGTVAGAEWQSLASSVPDGQTINVGGVAAKIDLVVGEGCSGTFEDYGNGEGYIFSYSSSNTSVATVTDPTGEDADVEGMSDGSATISGTVEDPEYDCEGSAQSTDQVIPSISGPSALWSFGGQNPNASSYPISITLSASGGSGTWSVTSGTSRISLSTTTGTETTLTPTGTHFSDTQNDTCLTITVSSKTSDPFCLTVRTPWKLVPNPGASGTESDPTYGYSTDISYDLHDNLDTLIAQDVTWNEVIGTAQNLNGSNWATCCGPIATGGGSTDPLTDLLKPPAINSTPTKPSPTPTFHNPPSGTTMYRQIPQSMRVGSSTSGTGVLVQSDNLTYWIDHGSHENIVVPSQPPE